MGIRKVFIPLAFAFAFVSLVSSPLLATVIVFNDFASTTGLTLNGSTTTVSTIPDGTVLQLTNSLTNRRGSAFLSNQLNATGFSTYFQFRTTGIGGDFPGVKGADGICFVAQNVSNTALGGLGLGIGYSGIVKSVAVEFDTWYNAGNADPDENHVGFLRNGSVVHDPATSPSLPVTAQFDDGNVWSVWVDYNGTQLQLRANQTGLRPTAALLAMNVDIPALLTGNSAYFGFTSGTGASYGEHKILNWEMRDSYSPIDNNAVPEPGSIAITGLLALAGILRKKSNRHR